MSGCDDIIANNGVLQYPALAVTISGGNIKVGGKSSVCATV